MFDPAKAKLLRSMRHWPLSERLAYNVAPPNELGCMLWIGKRDRNGYGRMKWRGKEQFTHRLSWEEAKGSVPIGLCVCHRCDVPACINIDHLWVGSQTENMEDKRAKGRSPKGEAHRDATLSEADVWAIREDSRLQRIIAEQYGIAQQSVSDIKARKTWTHLAGEA